MKQKVQFCIELREPMKKLKANKCLITILDGFNCHLGRDLSESFQTAVGKQLRDQNETSRNRMRLEDLYKENNLRIIYTFIKKKNKQTIYLDTSGYKWKLFTRYDNRRKSSRLYYMRRAYKQILGSEFGSSPSNCD